jgi:hypothetical protein
VVIDQQNPEWAQGLSKARYGLPRLYQLASKVSPAYRGDTGSCLFSPETFPDVTRRRGIS